MRNVRRIIMGMLVVSVAAILPALAGYAEGQKIGHVAFGRAYYSYDKVKASLQEVKDFDAKKEAERAKKVEAIEKMRQEIELLTGDARTAKGIEGENKIAELNEFERVAATERKKIEDQARQQNTMAIFKVIEEMGKSQGYDYVLFYRPETILYAKESNDLTDQVIQQLNKK